jgi:ubiquinone/menaquinone biosynthesis C-methylase UbiE
MFATITLMLTNIGKLNSKESTKAYFESIADRRQLWNRRNRFYHRSLENYFNFIVPPGSSVLEVGCGAGDLLAAVKPAYGVGIDISEKMVAIAASRFPDLNFRQHDIENVSIIPDLDAGRQQFDYIILSDLLHTLWDVQKALDNLRQFCHPSTRIVISNYNFLWEPVMKLTEHLRLKQPNPNSNWLSHHDIINLLEIEGFSLLTNYRKILLPVYIPVLNAIFNRFIINLPLINGLGLVNFVIARPSVQYSGDYSVSVIIPARNEKGNIESAITRTPAFGKSQEFIFVEGHSHDGTWEEMLRVKQLHPDKNIKLLVQTGKGKGNAVREGFDEASCEVLMILDADLTTPPEELPKFYDALVQGRGEFINGCRLVYPMEKEAMRFLNLLANKFFGWFFSYLLGQRLKDTLCGTKVIFTKDYNRIKANRAYFGDFDPFGDFDLLFGASKLNLKITEVIVRYKERTYGSTQISRFKHGWLLLKMSLFAAGKIKFI